ncbi:MAG: cbb3-type cytochrome c oxidase subunit 3 [Bacteroidota bacterium]
MLRDIFQSVAGYQHFGLISMFIFGVFFSLVIVHTYSLKKRDVEEFSRMPFDDSTKDSEKSEKI